MCVHCTLYRDFWPRQYISSNETLLLSSVLDDLTLRMNDVDVDRRITVTDIFHINVTSCDCNSRKSDDSIISSYMYIHTGCLKKKGE